MIRNAVLATAVSLSAAGPLFAQAMPDQQPHGEIQFQTSAINCVAVFELMSRELPYHLREPGMGLAWRVWHLEASRAEHGLERDIAVQINARMSELDARYHQDPYSLVDAAEICARFARTSLADRR